jgi:hypothetical protein
LLERVILLVHHISTPPRFAFHSGGGTCAQSRHIIALRLFQYSSNQRIMALPTGQKTGHALQIARFVHQC